MLTKLLTLAVGKTEAVEEPIAMESLASQVVPVLIAAVIGLAVSYGLGRVLAAFLHRRHFDELFATPWKPAFGRKQSDRWKVSTTIGWAVTLTGVVCLVWGVAQYRGYPNNLITQMVQNCGQAWLLLLTTLIALGLARIVAEAVISVFQNQTIRNQLELFCPHSQTSSTPDKPLVPQETEPDPENNQVNLDGESWADNATVKQTIADFTNETVEPASQKVSSSQKPEAFADSIARLVGLLVYLIVFLPVFMIAAGIWQWTATSEAISVILIWLIPFAGFSVVILLGWFAITAAIIAVMPTSQRRYVMIGTTLLVLLLLVASYNTAFALIFSVAIIALAWITRNDFPDALAGWYLQSQSNLTAKTPIGLGRISRVQLLTSDLVTVNGSFRVRNRHVLRSYLDGDTISESRLVAIDEKETSANSAQVSE